MKIKQALIKAFQKLKDKSSSADLDAEIILMKSLKQKTKNTPIDKTWLYTHSDYELSKTEIKKFRSLLNRRLAGEPIAYIIGHKEFFGLDFFVNRHVLIPRPETEIIVQETLKHIPHYHTSKCDKLKIADVGTGSGCIAISIAKNYPNAKIYASDISKKAIEVARQNARLNQVSSKIKFQINTNFRKSKLDVILANLPYLTQKQIQKDLKFEPHKALLGGTDGLDIYRTVLPKIKNNLAKKYLIIIECAPNQIPKLKRIVKKNLPDDPYLKTMKDLADKNRFLAITPSQPK